VAARGVGPAALLFSERIDSLAAGGVILAKVWNNADVVTVDGLGEEFLRFVEDGMLVTIKPDGTVTAG
jgi:predicted aconitase with swiveling domain